MNFNHKRVRSEGLEVVIECLLLSLGKTMARLLPVDYCLWNSCRSPSEEIELGLRNSSQWLAFLVSLLFCLGDERFGGKLVPRPPTAKG